MVPSSVPDSVIAETIPAFTQDTILADYSEVILEMSSPYVSDSVIPEIAPPFVQDILFL